MIVTEKRKTGFSNAGMHIALSIILVVMAMTLFLPAKVNAGDDLLVTRVDITADPLKIGTTVEGSGYTQTNVPAITNVKFNNEDVQLSEEEVWANLYLQANRDDGYYNGTVAADTVVYYGIGFEPMEVYWEFDENCEVYINGDKAVVQWFDPGYMYAFIKVTPEGDEPTPTPTPSAAAPMLAKMTSKGAKAMNFTWSKVVGAEGYDIYLSKCNHGGNKYTPQLVKSITGNKTAKWTKKGLKKNIPYKGYVKAYKMENGKKTYIGESLEMHAYTNGGNKKYTNAKSVSVKKTSVSLAAGKTHKIKASVKKLKAGKALPGKTHTAKLRYFSSNTSVATVSGNGTITAVAAGKCKVYAVAANGARKAVTVTVK